MSFLRPNSIVFVISFVVVNVTANTIRKIAHLISKTKHRIRLNHRVTIAC